MADLGVRCVVLAVVLCSVLLPSPTHGYIYAVSRLKASHMIPQILLIGRRCQLLCVCVCWQHYSNMTTMLFEDLPALFGAPLPKDGLMVRADDCRTASVQEESPCFIITSWFSLCAGSSGPDPPVERLFTGGPSSSAAAVFRRQHDQVHRSHQTLRL